MKYQSEREGEIVVVVETAIIVSFVVFYNFPQHYRIKRKIVRERMKSSEK